MLIAASSNSTDATPKDRQAWGGGGVCRGDWALVELSEDQILPNILSSHDDDPDDDLSDWRNALWPTGHSSAPERQQHTLFPSSKAPRHYLACAIPKGGIASNRRHHLSKVSCQGTPSNGIYRRSPVRGGDCSGACPGPTSSRICDHEGGGEKFSGFARLVGSASV